MANFFSLMHNEHTKIYKKLSTYIMIAILIALTIVPAIIIKYVNSREYEDSWGDEQYLAHLEQIMKDASEEEKPYYESEIKVVKYNIENGIEEGSWKRDAVSDMFSTFKEIGGENQSADNEDFTKIEAFVKNDDWRGYLNHQKEGYEKIIKESDGDSGYELVVDIIDMRLKYDIRPGTDIKSWKSDVLFSYGNAANDKDWAQESLKDKTLIEEEREYFEEVLDSSNKDMAKYRYRLENDIKPVEENSQWGFMNEIIQFLAINLIAVFIAIIAGAIVAGEFGNGTIKLLLIRPHRRWKLLASKYATLFVFTLEMLAIALVVSFVTGGIFFGFEGIPTFLRVSNGAVVEQSYLIRLLFETALNSVPLIITFTMAFMISTVFKSAGLSIGLSLFLLLTGPTVTMILAELKFKPAKYLITANWNLVNYFMDDISLIPFKGMTLAFSVVNVLIYFIIANVISFTIFAKRDVAT